MNPVTSKKESSSDYLERAFEGAFSSSDFSSGCRLSAFFQIEKGGGISGFNEAASLRLDSKAYWKQQVKKAVESSSKFFLETQNPEGYWWAELESNVTITAEYIMLLHLLEISEPEKERSMVKYLLHEQTSNGSWGLCYGDGGDISTTIEAYFALKLAGEDPDSEPLRRARGFILSKGGIESARVFTKIWLALFSQYDWDNVPSMPVELVLLPSHFYFSIYEFSSWARGTVVPLSIVLAIRPRYKLPDSKAVPELYVKKAGSGSKRFPSMTHKLFYLFDRVAKAFERHPIPSLRNRAVQAAETWILEHQEETGDWGGIQPPMVYSILALHYMGYTLDHPVIEKGLEALEGFCLEDEHGLRMQSCISPVWDTALTGLALVEAGISPEHPALVKATQWLLDKQIKKGGDWQVKNCCPPGGWAFEFVNNHYPDVDDSAVVLTTLHRMGTNQCGGLECGKSMGMEWCLSMQSSCGGWAAFDRDNTMTILNRIPFADTEAMVDYPTADVSGRVLETMGYYGYDRSDRRAKRGIKFIKDLQEPDGAWWGRWGVNYIYGTWSVLRGLISIGEDPKAPYIQAAVRWLKEHQNPDGGWGETCESYRYPQLRGKGASTPSQTAWALMGLLACGEEHSPEVRKGVQYLVETQKADGTWDEKYFTGTGFPNHFYIRYRNYCNCFPLMALGQYRRKLQEE
ncbi:squalene--hopene cyclase [Desulforhabdus amnigena]|uniref:Squalene-hopene cyclase n=1 Tax=Desulforhabdus amnigena TaxID=40218 RepID=A0A9W6FV04_9BACT|nr:squalene--hopene cyclase [Desulforhabdus amnigena]NLJ29430.1 squalene--hopene cyclase [Deltaproteobacteria bacterium]GLI35420.1 squalene-hopene cyclase [Desulforhabdus amnigena]